MYKFTNNELLSFGSQPKQKNDSYKTEGAGTAQGIAKAFYEQNGKFVGDMRANDEIRIPKISADFLMTRENTDLPPDPTSFFAHFITTAC